MERTRGGAWTHDLLFYRRTTLYTHPFSVFTQCSPSSSGDRGRPLLGRAGRHRQSKTRLGDTGEEVVIAINRRPTVASPRLLPTGSGRKEAAEGRDGSGRGAEVEVVAGNRDRRAGRRQVSWHESAARSSRSGSGGNSKPPGDLNERVKVEV